MQQNKYLTRYLKQQFDRQQNYDQILKKVKGSGYMNKKRILNIAAILLVVIIVAAMSPSIYAQIKWNIEYKEYQNREISYGSGAVDEAIKEYEKNVAMDYVYKDNIGVKIDSIMITDDYFKMNVNFRIPEDIEINTDTFVYGFAVYDENDNIYGVSGGMFYGSKNDEGSDYWKKLYKELDIKYDKKDVFAVQLNDSTSTGVVTSTRGNIITSTTMTSNKGFPKSKKLYIRIFKIGYNLIQFNEEKTQVVATDSVILTNQEWNFDIEIPEEFYNRETINLKISNEIDGFELTKAEVTETGMVLNVKLKGLVETIMEGREQTVQELQNAVNEIIHVEDKNGDKYNNINMGTTENKDEVKLKFDISKNDFKENEFYLCIRLENNNYKLKLGKGDVP